MGLLVEGKWVDRWYETKETGGKFVRQDAKWRDRVTADGKPAEGRTRGFKAEPGRYHLYVSLACPWAHRTLIFRKLKRLESIISLSVVDWLMAERGWRFSDRPGCIPDTVNGAGYLYEIYLTAKRDYTGRVTVPVLWDRKTATIVNNESAEIIRMFNSAFDGLTGVARELDFCPAELIGEIDEINAMIYDNSARLRSYEIVADIWKATAPAAANSAVK